MGIKKSTEQVLEQVYLAQGLQKTVEIARGLLKETEQKVAVQQECALIKGELAELVLFYTLMEMQKYLKVPNSIVKGLYVQDPSTKQVTEIDLAFITAKQIYLFECKSYAGKRKTLTDECKLWVSDNERANVYEQNKLHTITFNKMYGGYTLGGSKPYTMVFFDYSTTPFVDKREKKYQKGIPALTQASLVKWLLDDLNSKSEIKVDVKRMTQSIQLNKSKLQEELAREHRRQLNYKE